eukprot:scaffold3341_cov270-Chaetoceros_neogracile.AAC.31
MIAHEVVQSADLKAGDKVLEIGSYEPASDAQNRDSASECYDSAEMPRYYASGNSHVLENDNVYCRTGGGGGGEFPSDQDQRGLIQIESSEEEEHHSAHSDLNKSSDDTEDADDTVVDGENYR